MHDLTTIRSGFPALARTLDGSSVAYVDGPGGTQVHGSVIAAMAGFMERGGSNLHGPFVTSEETEAVVDDARRAVADLLGANPDEVVFGQNMTSLTYATSRAIARGWVEGDNIAVSRLDHDANVAPWLQAAADRGVEVRWLDFDPDHGCDLDLTALDTTLDGRTRLVAVTHASNAVGTIPSVRTVVEAAHSVGAVTYVDAVHYAPHRSIDVADLGTDFLAVSAYKWFGPHTGCLYGRRDHLTALEPYKLRPSPDTHPDRWETGTQSFESLAGVAAAVDYLAGLGDGRDRRERLIDAYRWIVRHEEILSDRFLRGAAEIDGVRLFGRQEAQGRTPTFALEVRDRNPEDVARQLGTEGVFVWAGDYYAYEVMRRLGRAEHGLVRIGFVHYNTVDEVDAVLAALERAAG